MNDGTQGVDLVALLDTRESVLAELKEKREMLGRLDWQIERHLNAQEATFYENDGWTVELKSKIVWNEDALQPLQRVAAEKRWTLKGLSLSQATGSA